MKKKNNNSIELKGSEKKIQLTIDQYVVMHKQLFKISILSKCSHFELINEKHIETESPPNCTTCLLIDHHHHQQCDARNSRTFSKIVSDE